MPILPHADAALLNAALIGLNSQLEGIDRQMAAVKAMLAGQAADNPAAAGKPGRKRRPMSAATKKRMALAQRKRWATYRKAQKA